MRAALLRLRRTSGLPVAFGGLLVRRPSRPDRRAERHADAARCAGSSSRRATASAARRSPCHGRARSRTTASSRHISHEYDTAVAAEGLRSVVAVPVVVRRPVRGVLYGALREPLSRSATVRSTRRRRRPGTWSRPWPSGTRCSSCWRRPGSRSRSGRGAGRLGGGPRGAPRAARAGPEDRRPGAARRSCWRCAAGSRRPRGRTGTQRRRGCGWRRARWMSSPAWPRARRTRSAAERLGLRPETVKGYLRSAMRKLGAHTRLEAVVAARRAGLRACWP